MATRKRQYSDYKKQFRLPTLHEGCLGDGLDFVSGQFVFRPHFFDKYRERVFLDEEAHYRTNQEISDILIHSLEDSEIPSRLSKKEDYKLLVNIHHHEGENRNDFGIFYVPIRRDRYDINSKRICLITILNCQERLDFLSSRKLI